MIEKNPRRKSNIIYGNDIAKQRVATTVTKARSFALGSDQRHSFIRSLSSINRWKRSNGSITLYTDFCDYSFCWQAGVYGGFIFHQNVQEWSVHT